jgi:uncharacterized protein YecE (DUF72 family)
MNLSLFHDHEPAPKQHAAKSSAVMPVPADEILCSLAQSLPSALRLGTSSWSYPGWAGLVWDQPYSEAKLAKEGLRAYCQHPLLRTVSLDRAFYRPMTAQQYAQLAAQVSDDFRFVVKVPSMISDAVIRGSAGEKAGRGLQANPHFLDAALFQEACLKPVLQGLGPKLGALVLQMSPLPSQMLNKSDIHQVFERIGGILSMQYAIKNIVSDAVMAIEVRNSEFITTPLRDGLIAVLKNTGATYCLGLHAKLPPLEDQLPILRKLWPAPLLCRWNLHPLHGRFGYEAAKAHYAPFDKLVDEDPATRTQLARVIAGTIKGGQKAFVTINNKAEGSAPLSVYKLAQAVSQQL